VSVILLPDMRNGTHSGADIMNFVIRKCNAGQTAMTHQPLHGSGDHCISLPVKWDTPRQTMRAVREQAAALATWWLEQICEERIAIDQKMVFDDRNRTAFKVISNALPAEWGKPEYSD
jgi:hypothetical protein